jgi:carbon storage regulator CsrA
MLVLSRKIGQQICLPGLGVIVTVVAASGGKVRLAVSAPPEVGVYREEVQLRRAAEATKPPPGADDP